MLTDEPREGAKIEAERSRRLGQRVGVALTRTRGTSSFRPFRRSAAFAVGALAHYVVVGMRDAAFSALVLGTVGRRAAATKFIVISSIGSVPLLYMTALSGWVHDRSGTTRMLGVEALVAVACLGLGAPALRRLMRRSSVASVTDPTDDLPLAVL